MELSITLVIILITVGVSLLVFEKPELKYRYIFSPYQVVHQNKWYKIITHAFIHADFIHLGLNMYVLYMFGNHVENFFVSRYDILGYFFYIVLYFGGILFATIPAMSKHKDNDLYFSLGASGAVSAVLFASVLIFPQAQLGILFLPFRIPAVIFGPLYLALEYFLSKRSQSRIAHDAHFAGALFGIIFLLLLDFNYFINNFIVELQNIFN